MCRTKKYGRHQGGYGRVQYKGEVRLAHRVAFEISSSLEVPKGMFVCHSCDNPSCVNPEHLFVGSCTDNNRDKNSKGRGNYPENKGEKNPRSKLTILQVSEIRALLSSGETQENIRKLYGVCRQAIGDIKTGRTWKI